MPPRAMDRSITTCRSCRRRKIRCDRSRPRCNRCRETSASCVYEDQVPQPAPVYQFVEETPGLPALSRSSTNSVENIVPQPQQAMVSMPQERLRFIESRVEVLSEMIRTLQSQHVQNSSQWSVEASTTSVAEPVMSIDQTGHLYQQDDGRMRYVEPTFWASLNKEVADLDKLLTGQMNFVSECEVVEESEWSPNFTAERSPRTANRFGFQIQPKSEPAETRPVPGMDFFRQLPPKALADSLLKGYTHGYHPMVPLFHMPTFRKRYEAFWLHINDSSVLFPGSMSFASLLLGVLYAGAISCPDLIQASPFSMLAPKDLTKHLRALGTRAVQLCNFSTTPTLESLAAYILLETTSLRREEPLDCLAFVGMALRTATILGLHKDPSHFTSIGPIEAETRRRIWWHIVHTDVNVAIASGLPPVIDTASWDVQSITELKEEFWDTQIGRDYDAAVRCGDGAKDSVDDPRKSGFRSLVSTSGILVAGKLRSSLVLRRTLARLFTGGPVSEQQVKGMRSEFKLLNEDLSSRISRIPETVRDDRTGTVCPSATYENNVALNRWSRLLLSAFIDQNYCLICHPVLKSTAGSIWTDLYPTAVERCQSLLFKTAQLATLPNFRNFRWSWPGNHQPLQAINIVLLNVLSTPAPNTSASCFRSRRALDITFALCTSGGGLSDERGGYMNRPLTEGGKEAWSHLHRLRERAWRHAGWDPCLKWSREHAVAIVSAADESQMNPTTVDGATNCDGAMAEPEPRSMSGVGDDVPGLEADAFSPANIDWAYLDAVLDGTRDPMDLSFDFGEMDGP